MPLTLRAISLNDRPLTQPITARFDSEGGSIGRADHNTLALPDPERHISRQHAEIRANADGYSIRNVGSANPIVVCGQPLGRGESARIGHQDQVRIGGYLLEVLEEDASDGRGAVAMTADSVPAPVGARGPTALRRPPPAPPAPFAAFAPSAPSAPFSNFGPRTGPGSGASGLADLNAPLAAGNPFADLLGDSPPAPAFSSFAPPSGTVPDAVDKNARTAPPASPRPSPASAWGARPASAPGPDSAPRPPPARPADDPFADLFPPAAGIPSASAAWAPAAPTPPPSLLPDDFDPFAMPAPPPRPAAPTPSSDAGLFEDLIPSAAPASIDQLFDLRPGGRDALADFLADQPRPGANDADTSPGLSRVSTDPMAMFDSPSATPPPRGAESSRADHLPELRAAFVPARVQAPLSPAASKGTPRPQGAPASAVDGHAPSEARTLWAAFCAGAGVAIDVPQGAGPEQMQLIGGLLRAAVDGTLQLMMVRATTKHELGADVTMIRARNNNPLKFSPDAASALEQLLKPPLRGFLPGPAAMTDAMHDLVGHTIGTMTGTRAALEGVLDRFGPPQLEAKLAGKSVLDTLLPMSRKAKLWELYLQHFDAIRNEAQDDFHALFGRAFLAAYEQQLEQLRQGAPDAGK